jgi:acyl-CoA synthetase (NDP forming)
MKTANMLKNEIYNNLKALFNPASVAVIGASENPEKLGFHVMMSLTKGAFKGLIVPVNPNGKEIMGIPSFSSITQFQQPIDLAVIVVPAERVPAIFEECSLKGVKGIVLISAGFKELGDHTGTERHNKLAQIAGEAGMPVIGPNTIGMANAHNNLNASFYPEFSLAIKGRVAMVSQSGGIANILAADAMRYNIGISKIVPLGNRLNVDFAEIVRFLMGDHDTKVIALHMEGMDQPRELMEAAKAGGGEKPVVAYKVGKEGKGDQASFSHTGSMSGKLEIYQGAMGQAGILCVDSIQSLLDAAKVLSGSTLPEGPRVAVVTGQAGPGLVAAHVCEDEGLELVSFKPETQALINDIVPHFAHRTNPVDLGPGAVWYNPSAVHEILNALMNDQNVDAVLFLMTYASANRETISNISEFLIERNRKKPIISCIFAPPGVWDDQIRRLEEAGTIVNLPTPERAVKGLSLLWQYKKISEQVWG